MTAADLGSWAATVAAIAAPLAICYGVYRWATRRDRTHLLAPDDVAGSCTDDLMAVAEATYEVDPCELAGLCDSEVAAYVRMRSTADARGVGVRELFELLRTEIRTRPYAEACTAVTDRLLDTYATPTSGEGL